jgi:hypothetical protein
MVTANTSYLALGWVLENLGTFEVENYGCGFERLDRNKYR